MGAPAAALLLRAHSTKSVASSGEAPPVLRGFGQSAKRRTFLVRGRPASPHGRRPPREQDRPRYVARRQVPGHPRARTRRNGRRLRGGARQHRQASRREGARRRARELVHRHRALLPRGARRREREEPLHRRGVRLRPPRRRAALHRHGAARGRVALRPDGARAPHRSGDDRPHHRPGRQGPHEGPRDRHRPPRSQAREHSPLQGRRRRGGRQDPRLRARQVLLARQDRREDRAAHARGGRVRHARVHVARSRSRGRGASTTGPTSGRSAAWRTSA